MTLETSLENRKPARHALGIALRECAIPGVVVALLMGFLLAAPAAAISRNPYLAGRITYYYGEPVVSAVFPIVMALAGVVQGLFAFSLLFSRSASNTYFGLGLSRRQLFAARYAAGALWLAAAAVFATASGVLVNLVFISRSGLILGRGLYIGAGLLTTALIAYTLTAVVCSLSGTLGEGLLYSLLAALIPTLLLTGLGNQMNALLRGSPYGYSQMSDYVWDHNLPGNLFGEFTLLNPALFFYPYFAAYCAVVSCRAAPVARAGRGWLAVTAVRRAARCILSRGGLKAALRARARRLASPCCSRSHTRPSPCFCPSIGGSPGRFRPRLPPARRCRRAYTARWPFRCGSQAVPSGGGCSPSRRCRRQHLR